MTDNKVALITGANSGIGLELTKRLLGEAWHVAALIRSDFPAEEDQIAHARQSGQLRVYRADLSDYTSLKRAFEEIRAGEKQIDVLFNNAGAVARGIRLSPQGHEMHFEVNTVVPYITLMELKPLLEQGTDKTVVHTSSNALLFVRRFDLRLLQHPPTYKPLTGPYGVSKLGLSLWTQAIASTLMADGIEIRSVNPGANQTKMTGSPDAPTWMQLARRLFFSHPRVGAGRVYDVALGRWRGASGVFVDKGKAKRLPFMQEAPGVLDLVRTIYEQEFRNHASS